MSEGEHLPNFTAALNKERQMYGRLLSRAERSFFDRRPSVGGLPASNKTDDTVVTYQNVAIVDDKADSTLTYREVISNLAETDEDLYDKAY